MPKRALKDAEENIARARKLINQYVPEGHPDTYLTPLSPDELALWEKLLRSIE